MLKTCIECAEVIKKYFDKNVGWTKENLMADGIMVSAPDFCPKCWQNLGSNLNAEGYLSLISK